MRIFYQDSRQEANFRAVSNKPSFGVRRTCQGCGGKRPPAGFKKVGGRWLAPCCQKDGAK